jgi:methylenetetrahydrofolate dehydrogenase (NADP+) / methenyltetrahydrofolate cyclohydrolase
MTTGERSADSCEAVRLGDPVSPKWGTPVSAQIMSGAELAASIIDRCAERAAGLVRTAGVRPCLATVLVGDDPASVTYVRMKQRRCAKAGIESRHIGLPEDITTDGLVAEIRKLADDPGVHGILLQHPVPAHIDERAAFEAIAPEKDVDGVTTASFAAMAFGHGGFASCTPGGIMRLLDAYGVELAGKHAVVVGRSPILGKPVGMLLLGRDATVTYCHSKTTDLPAVLATADIVVAAVGRPELIRGEDIKPGAVVVDAGYNAGNVGDVDFAGAAARASLVTPVPGGVGPMTIAVLLEQTVDAAERQTAAVSR